MVHGAFQFRQVNSRHGLCSDLGFSVPDRSENIRRIGKMAKLFVDAGVIALTAFISPRAQDREQVRRLIGDRDFIEIYCRCPLEVCERRDTKGMYARARKGDIPEFTGISAPYEPPVKPDLALDTDTTTLEACAEDVIRLLEQKRVIGDRESQE